MAVESTPQGGATILSRLFEPNVASLSPEAAEGLLTIGFSKEDKARMHDLAVRNQDGALSEDERKDLIGYIEAGHILGLLHAKARLSLKHSRRGR